MRSRRLPWGGWVGLGALAGGKAGLLLGVFWVEVYFYLLAWWGYILLVDGLVWRRGGASLLRDRPREFLALAFWSVPLWSAFELLNFRLQNWFYVNVLPSHAAGTAMTALAYATVLPGLVETRDLLAAHGAFERWRLRPRALPAACWRWLPVAGMAMLAAALLWPRLAFPLVWVFAVPLLDPLCHRLGARSVLDEVARGDPRPCLRMLAAGLICGLLWEFWNFWAHTKWIYTVPFFEQVKWFEMPPLGFLGFPPFALECAVVMNLLDWARARARWRHVRVAAGAAAAGFSLGVYAGIDAWTVESRSSRLTAVAGLEPATVERLARAGVTRPRTLVQEMRTADGAAALARRAGIEPGDLARAREAARLVETQGLGPEHQRALRGLGIASVEELARQDPGALHARWVAAAGAAAPPPARVRVWVAAARTAAGPAGSR